MWLQGWDPGIGEDLYHNDKIGRILNREGIMANRIFGDTQRFFWIKTKGGSQSTGLSMRSTEGKWNIKIQSPIFRGMCFVIKTRFFSNDPEFREIMIPSHLYGDWKVWILFLNFEGTFGSLIWLMDSRFVILRITQGRCSFNDSDFRIGGTGIGFYYKRGWGLYSSITVSTFISYKFYISFFLLLIWELRVSWWERWVI